MEETAKVLKEGTNKALVVGTLVEKNLEEKTFLNSNNENVEAISGTISIRTSEDEIHHIRLYSNKLTKEGKVNSLYKGYMTVKDEFVSVADVAEAKTKGIELVADEVSVNGRLTTNEYYGQDGQLRQFQQIDGRFVNRLKETDDRTPRTEFQVDIYINKVKPEIVDSEETDRVEVEGLVPTYNGIFPYKFKVIPQGSDYFQNDLQRGQTIKVFGTILNVKKEHRKLVEMAFGEPREEITYTYVSESLINGAAEPYEEDSVNTFDPALVKDRMAARDVYLEQQKARQNNQNQSNNNAGNFGGNSSNQSPGKKDAPVDVSKLF